MAALLICLGLQLPAQTFLNYAVVQPAELQVVAGLDALICPGDSVMIGAANAATGGYGGYQYLWTPGTGLSSSTSPDPLAFPSQSTTFTLAVTDSMGCTASDDITVVVDTCVGMPELAGVQSFDVFPNPNSGAFQLRLQFAEQFEWVVIQLTDLQGRVLERREVERPGLQYQAEFRPNAIARGQYFLQVMANDQWLSRKVLIQ